MSSFEFILNVLKGLLSHCEGNGIMSLHTSKPLCDPSIPSEPCPSYHCCPYLLFKTKPLITFMHSYPVVLKLMVCMKPKGFNNMCLSAVNTFCATLLILPMHQGKPGLHCPQKRPKLGFTGIYWLFQKVTIALSIKLKGHNIGWN